MARRLARHWGDIVAATIEQLRMTRAALICLARAIQAHENARDHEEETIAPLPSRAVEEFDTEPWRMLRADRSVVPC
jgi:hypothetical protein